MAKKGQTFKSYSAELKLEALELKKQGWTKREIAEYLSIKDPDQIKVWARKYQLHGPDGLMDRRGRWRETNDSAKIQYIEKLEMENRVLKKYLDILAKGAQQQLFK